MKALGAHLGRVCRRLVRTPLFTVVAVLTLGVGIGANTALFSVVYGVLLTPLPYHQAERLVGVWHKAPGMDADVVVLSRDLRVVLTAVAGAVVYE